MNSPNNNINTSLLLKKIYCYLLFGFWGILVFGQNEEIDPNGYNVFYYENGEVASEGYFQDGLPHGVWKSYYPSGTLKSIGKKDHGQSDSLWKFFDKEGKLTWSYEYANDMKNGCATKYDSLGNVEKEAFYVDDVKQGEEQWFYPDGSLKKIVHYENGDEDGLAVTYNKEGIIIEEEIYNDGFLRKKQTFNQLDEKGEKTGVWRTYFPNGNIKTEISYDRGKMDGTAKEFDKTGKLVNINTMKGDSVASDPGGVVMIDLYKEYHPNGKVKLVGGLNKGMRSGIFREYDLEGNLVQGYVYIRDTLVSEGMILPGGIFEGEWKTYYKNGQIKAKGPFKNGKKHGKWVFYYPDGKKEQEGSFNENVLSGQWTWYYHNGQIKREEFFNRKGLLEGLVVEYDSLGNELAKGEYFNGEREGSWFYHVGDFKEVGAFIFGERDGVWTHYYKNGKVAFQGEFLEGEPRGKHVYYHKNGIKKLIGKYSGGEKHGVWREFNNRGEEIETIQYRRGEIYKINGFRVNQIETVE